MSQPYAHLHVHSDFSLLDGCAKIDRLVKAAADAEQPALALTDHGNLCGAVEFYKAAGKAGVKPLIGMGAYLAPRSRKDRERNPVAAHHLLLLAMNDTGYRNLIQLSTRSFTEGYYYRPRIDRELLGAHNEGLIATSACMGGEPAYYAKHDDVERAQRAVESMKEIFGDRYYVELQRNGGEGQQRVGGYLLDIARKTNTPVVATQDVHYIHPDDSEAHVVHRCIGQGKTLREYTMRHGGSLHFRSTAEMNEAFQDLPEALANTIQIADRCNFELELGEYHLPRFAPPEGHDELSFFKHLCQLGAERLYGAPLSEAVKERMAYEQKIIEEMGFVAYFLITWDFVDFAKREGIPVGPGRGSAAGSLVSYALGITTVDPLEYDLLFERFLNPARISMPDIDIDFCKDGRERVIRYVQDKYGGKDCVSQIITFGRMNARAVIRDVGRVLEVPLRDVDILAKKIPSGPGATLGAAFEADPDLRKEVDDNEEYRRLIDIALKLEGMNRNASKHAAGVVVGDGPLAQYAPLYKVGEELATQFTMDQLEDIGLLKMDFLGLRTLTIIDKTLDNIRRGGVEPPDMATLPLDDAPTFEMLARGDALGVFQVEGSGMREVLKRIGPDCFDDLSTVIALYRPGPMGSGMMDMYIERKNGREEVSFPDPSLEPILEETQGVVVYQEQVMRITNVLAGFTLPDADNLRKAMGKKKPEILAKFRDKFVDGCEGNGMDRGQATEIWNQLEHFAGYGFNKSHTVAYGIITYQTAYLKRHHPKAFMAALLTCEMADQDKLAEYIEESRRMGIDVLLPDVGKSDWEFLVEGENIRYGLAAVKGVGRSAADAIVAGREDRPYTSIYDLGERVDLSKVNKSTLEALIKAGAFDCTKARRSQVMEVLERALSLGQRAHADRQAGQLGLFGGGAQDDTPEVADYPDIPEWPDSELLAWEREAIGYYATSHPLAEHERLLRLLAGTTTRDCPELTDRTAVRLGGLVRQARTSIVKSGRNEGRRMGFFMLEDFQGTIECVCFARTYAEVGHLMESDRILFVEGKVDTSRDSPSIHVDRLIPMEEAPRRLAQGVLLRMAEVNEDILGRLRDSLVRRSGSLPVVLEFAPEPKALARVKAGPAWAVMASDDLLREVQAEVPEIRGAEFLAHAP